MRLLLLIVVVVVVGTFVARGETTKSFYRRLFGQRSTWQIEVKIVVQRGEGRGGDKTECLQRPLLIG